MIIQRIFETMKEKNIKQIDIANALNIQKSVVSNWKNRNCDPPAEFIPIIANLLNVSVSFLMTGFENTDLQKQYYDFAKTLENIGVTKDDLDKLLQLYEMIKPQNKNN